jgi:hypothetical protein
MAKTYKPGFVYIKSHALKQEVAWRKKDGRVFCEDGVQYSPEELAIMEAAGVEIDMATHNVKKVLGGKVVKIERTTNKNKPAETGAGDDTANNQNTREKISGVDEHSEGGASGELEIF